MIANIVEQLHRDSTEQHFRATIPAGVNLSGADPCVHVHEPRAERSLREWTREVGRTIGLWAPEPHRKLEDEFLGRSVGWSN